MHFKVTTVLIILGAIGFVLSLVRGSEVWELTRRRNELIQEVGLLEIGEPDKVHVVALETSDAMHFRWRCYMPANYTIKLASNGSSTSTRSDEEDFVAEVRFRVVEGRLMQYHKLQGGSGLRTVGTKELAALIGNRWDELDVEQLGTDGAVTIGRSEYSVLLKIALPPTLRREAEQRLREHEFEHFKDAIVTLRFGDAAAIE